MAKAVPCACEPFSDALRTGFVEWVGDDLCLASLASVGSVRSMIYGPKIAHCPFCGAELGKPAPLPPAKTHR